MNYEDDTPLEKEEDDEGEEDGRYVPEAPPQILSHPQSFRVLAGNTIILPCQVVNTGL